VEAGEPAALVSPTFARILAAWLDFDALVRDRHPCVTARVAILRPQQFVQRANVGHARLSSVGQRAFDAHGLDTHTERM